MNLDEAEYRDQKRFGISGRNQAADLYLDNKFLWHERSYFPYNWYKKPNFSIWFI